MKWEIASAGEEGVFKFAPIAQPLDPIKDRFISAVPASTPYDLALLLAALMNGECGLRIVRRTKDIYVRQMKAPIIVGHPPEARVYIEEGLQGVVVENECVNPHPPAECGA